MKSVKLMLLSFVLCLFASVSYSQNNFELDTIFTIDKTKLELYNSSKMYIVSSFKSANDVIQLDDFETGIIVVKGSLMESVNYSLSTKKYYFTFTLKIFMKDNKYRIVIEDIKNTISPVNHNLLLIGKYRGAFQDNLPKGKYEELMNKLSIRINNIKETIINEIIIEKKLKDW